MNPFLASGVIIGLVVIATLLGVLWRARTGRVRETSGRSVTPRQLEADGAFGAEATIVQFSTEFCGPCRIAERILGQVASRLRGVAYLDVDLTSRPHLATEFGVVQTPTILLLDAAGGIRSRIGGVPREDDVIARLDEIMKENHVASR